MILAAHTKKRKPLAWRVGSAILLAIFTVTLSDPLAAANFSGSQPDPLFLSSETAVRFSKFAARVSAQSAPALMIDGMEEVFEKLGKKFSAQFIRYEFEENGKTKILEFAYDARRREIIFYEPVSKRFAVYSLSGQNSRAELIKFGIANRYHGGPLLEKFVIEPCRIERAGQFIPVYTFRVLNRQDYLVRERAVSETSGSLGPIGRVLRYFGPDGDLEYFYQDPLWKGNTPAVMVRNYRIRRRLTLEMSARRLRDNRDSLGGPAKVRVWLQDFEKNLTSKNFIQALREHGLWTKGSEARVSGPEQVRIYRKLVAYERGPPARSGGTIDSPSKFEIVKNPAAGTLFPQSGILFFYDTGFKKTSGVNP